MSTTPAVTAPAPWRALLTTHLSQTSNREFALATTTRGTPNNPPTPHVRTVGFRGFFPEPQLATPAIEALQKNGVGLNPEIYESDMLSFTTDARMEKVNDLRDSGGLVEGVFWFKEVMSQWRVRGKSVIIGDSDGGTLDVGVEDEARRVVGENLRLKSHANEEDVSGWNWERMVTTYFANHTPILRGSFKAPPPGQPKPKSGLPPDSPFKIGAKVHDVHDPIARQNFRVVVIRPEVVERLDLSDYENPGRWRWVLEGGRWVEVELWP